MWRSTWLLALRVFACFASANIAYTFEIPNGACSLKRSLRRKRLMLNTVSGVSAVNGSSVYLRARGDAANERDGVPCVHPTSTAPRWEGGRRCTCGPSCMQSTC